MIKILLDAGSDVTVRNMYGNTVLMLALLNKANADVIKMLIDAGSDTTAVTAQKSVVFNHHHPYSSPTW